MPDVAVILCAGRGTRMGALTADRPKCALPVGGEPILQRAMRQLRQAGVQRFEVVGGHRWEAIPRENWRWHDRLLINHDFVTTNTLASLACVPQQELQDGFWLLNGDVVLEDTDVLRLGCAGSALLLRQGEVGMEEVKVTAYGHSRVVDISKGIDPQAADGEFIGLARFEAPFARCLLTALLALKSRDPAFRQHYFEEAIQYAALVEHLGIVPMLGRGVEIDTSEDYARAREMFG